MADYDFSTLNSSDFEELVCDLLNHEQAKSNSIIKYKTFKEGKDKGIDFLYSLNSHPYSHVGQVKHFYRSGYKSMYNHLKATEVDKVKNLIPNKYIFATSVDLSVANTEAIKELFNPFIKNLNDIYGKKDINRLIENHEKILSTHYKLWLSDFSILNKIINSELEFRSSHFAENELKKRLRLYVRTSVFDTSRELLKKNKFIIITGEPGIGKTTLAEMLVYEYIGNGYNLSYILDDIKEAEKVLYPDDSKQIIYFDDFLGSNKVEINRAKGRESTLLKILNRISLMENKLIVFTTRTFLLHTVVEDSEKLQRFNIKAKSSIIQLADYNSEVRKKILINHIEETDIKSSLKAVLYHESIQKFIINHSNFSPRSIEFITSNDTINSFERDEFIKFIYKNFNYPSDIWKHAYSEQISEDERLLLNTLISFGNSCEIKYLESAFANRVDFEVENNNKSKEMHLFKKTLHRLDGGFIIIRNEIEVHFINPSLIDFLQKYLQEDKDEVQKIILSIKYVPQLTERLFSLGSATKNKIPEKLERKLLLNFHSFIRVENYNSDLLYLMLAINKFGTNPKKETIICEIIESINEWEDLYLDYDLNTHFVTFLNSVSKNGNTYLSLKLRSEEIFSAIFIGTDDLDDAIKLLENFREKFEIHFTSYESINIVSHLDYLFEETIDSEIHDFKSRIKDTDEVFERKDELQDLEVRINELGIDYHVNFEKFDIDWSNISWVNEMRDRMDSDN